MPTKLTDAERAAIVAGLREGKSVREVAEETGRGFATVARVGREEDVGLTRAAPKTAIEANSIRTRERLAELAGLLVDDAHRLHEQLFAPHMAFSFGGKDNVYTEHEVPEPTARDKQAIMTSIGIAVQRAAEIVHGEAPGVDEAKGLVKELLDGVSEWARSE